MRRIEYRTPLGFAIISRTDAATTRPALEHAGWRCEACRQDDELRVCLGGRDELVVLCSGCRTTLDEFKKVLLRRTYSFKTTTKENST
jgi:hypothetical protein